MIHVWNCDKRLCILKYLAGQGFAASNVHTGQGSGHVALLLGDVDGDRRKDVIQLWNNNGRLSIIYYTGASLFHSAGFANTEQGTGALQYFMGDVDGDKRDDLIHLWNCNNRLCIMYYTVRRSIIQIFDLHKIV